MSSRSLIVALCESENDGVLYNELVRRFIKPLKEECKRLCQKRKIDPHIGEEIVHQVFERIKKYKKTFKSEKCKEENCDKPLMAWMYRIASNLFYDYHRTQKVEDEEPVESYFDDFLQKSRAIPAERLHNIKNLAEHIMSKLNPKERSVILADLEYRKVRKNLPSDINQEMAEELGVKKETIRKIRERAKAKINILIDEINAE